jgi:hypothetical protein
LPREVHGTDVNEGHTATALWLIGQADHGVGARQMTSDGIAQDHDAVEWDVLSSADAGDDQLAHGDLS